MDEIELTELTDLDVIRQDAVKNPASGFPFLIMKAAAEDCGSAGCGCCENCGMQAAAKAVNAVGGIDEQPDIDGADRVLQELAKLIIAEAQEMAVGANEDCDLHILLEAVSLMRCFRENEEWGSYEDDGSMMKDADGLVFKAHRKFSSDERKSLADKGHALPDGSYPIPDADALRRAAILARSGHGDVAAAKRLIAKRAKELGVANPLADKTAKDSTVADEPTQTTEPTEVQNGDELSKDTVAKMIEDALAEVSKDAKEREKALADELAVLKATPIPGNVVLTAPQGARDERAKNENVAKAAHYRNLAAKVQDRELQKYYADKARAAEDAAR